MNNLFFCCDEKYIKFINNVIFGLTKYNDISLFTLNFIVSSPNVSFDILERKITKTINKYNTEHSIKYTIREFILPQEVKEQLDKLSKLLKKSPLFDIHVKDKQKKRAISIFSNPGNWVRMFIYDIYPELTCGLYLDLDILINGDISPIFENDYTGYAIGAVPTCKEKQKLNPTIISKIQASGNVDGYNQLIDFIKTCGDINPADFNNISYNCGVLYLNLVEWRKRNITNKIFGLLNHIISKTELLFTSGTDLIMNIIAPDYFELDGTYNGIVKYTLRKSIFKQAIIHFKGCQDIQENKLYKIIIKNAIRIAE
jgi:lipopolysaccharide biosynthesis glycosyltransferase